MSTESTAEYSPVPGMVTAQEIADAVRVRPATVRRWARNGTLPPPHPGIGKLRWPETEITEWINRHNHGAE